MTSSLEELPTKAEEAPSPHEVKLTLLNKKGKWKRGGGGGGGGGGQLILKRDGDQKKSEYLR